MLSALGRPPLVLGRQLEAALPRYGCQSCISVVGGRGATRLAASITLVDRLLDREWMMDAPDAEISEVRTRAASFAAVRDDLAHPYVSGNKRRKLDGLWPDLVRAGYHDVVTLGGTQSAHVLAVAAAAASTGMRAHLLIRGERPTVPSGNHLFARMLAHRVEYVSRGDYADRTAVLAAYAERLEAEQGADVARIAVVPEGGAEAAALLGMVRLVRWLAASSAIPGAAPTTLVIDSGTGTSAIGLALGAALLELPWEVIGVTLAGPQQYYEEQQSLLVAAFCREHGVPGAVAAAVAARLRWAPRRVPRKFGDVLPGEIRRCAGLAAEHGILLDPIWTLPAWEAAEAEAAACAERRVVMIHSGGALGLCGLAQRFPDEF